MRRSAPDSSTSFSLPQIALGYGALALVGTLFTVIAARTPERANDNVVVDRRAGRI
jgi:hypothetical protein